MLKYSKAIVTFLVMLGLVVLQSVYGVYDGGITGYEWLGVAAVVLGPTGLVAALANTSFSPATKALVHQVAVVAIIVIQGVQDVYAGGISDKEWLGVGVLLLTNLMVYFMPTSAPQQPSTLVRRL